MNTSDDSTLPALSEKLREIAQALESIEAKERRRVELPKLAYSIAEAAEATGYTPHAIRAHIKLGNIIPRYANSRAVIEVDELRGWLERLPAEWPPPQRYRAN